MTEQVVAWSARHSRAVFAIAGLAAAAGALGWCRLGRDVLPDLSDPQIVLVAEWMGHPAAEVASSVARPLTEVLEQVPGATAVRASSMSGMAYLDVVFPSVTSLSAGRQAILERVGTLTNRLPSNVRVHVGPKASSTGWVYEYVLVDPARHESPLSMRRFQDEVLRPALASIPGVAEVASVGGATEQVVVEVRDADLRQRRLAFTDVLSTVRSALAGPRPPAGLEALKALEVVTPSAPGRDGPARDDRPRRPDAARVVDVANVRVTSDPGTGFADFGGSFQAVGGIVIAERGADLPAVIARVKRTLERKGAEHPGHLEIVTVHDRMSLVNRVGKTLWRALAEEIVVAGLVILIFLLDGASALVPLVTLPVVLLLAFGAMWLFGLPATLMSLSGMGMALGMAVDSDVVALEACHRRLEASSARLPSDRGRGALVAAAAAFTPAIQTSLLIAALTFLPVLAWTGETGRLLRPLALGKTFVIAAAALVTFTLAPALRDRLLGGRAQARREHRLLRGLVRVYRPMVHFALSRPTLTLTTAALAVATCLPILPRLGGEFLPRIDEGDLLFMPTTLAGIPTHEAMRELRAMDRAISAFPEVATVFGKVGRADSATDPAPYSMAETIIRLRPREEWPESYRPRWYSAWAPAPLRLVLRHFWPERSAATNAELADRLTRAAALPGWTPAWTAPVRARLDMMSTGVRTALAIRIVAASTERLATLGPKLRAALLRIPGTRSATLESQGGETWPRFEVDEGARALHHVEAGTAEDTARLMLTGGELGQLGRPATLVSPAEEDGRHPRVYIASEDNDAMHAPAERAREVTVRARSSDGRPGDPVPLALLGQITYADSPAVVRTEHGALVSYIYVDVDVDAPGAGGSDLMSYVKRARLELGSDAAMARLGLEPGERWELAGQYELLAAGQRRLAWIIPIVILSMLGLLRLQFGSLSEALIVMLSVPFALVGSFWALFWLGYRLSPPVWVGLISVLGLAMQTGVVMVVYIDEAFHRRVRAGRLRCRADIVAAHAEGTVKRLRPKLMTVTTMAASLLPLLWAEGAGAEIMRRVAAPMLGGLVTSAFLTLEVLPVIYTIWRHRQLLRAARRGLPIEAIVGRAPAWARRAPEEPTSVV
jgi:Cu(I)/Ag(I) efflux system membrane protein CusA/SilA